MSANNIFRSDLEKLYNMVQSSMILYPKEVVIATLKDYFSKDSYYHYSKDAWGFVNNPDHTDLPIDAGLYDNTTTRIFIGENFRHNEGIFYPAVLVKSGGSKYIPISINRECQSVQYDGRVFQDGYGNSTIIRYPKCFIFAGAWEGSISVDIKSRSSNARDHLVELIAMCFTDIHFDDLQDVGVICKPPSISGPTETEDRNDKLFNQTVSMDIRTEWRREIPISNIIERVLFTVDFQDIEHDTPPALNLRIRTDLNYSDMILNLEI